MQRLFLKITIFILGLWLLLNVLAYIANLVAPMNEWYSGAYHQYTDLLKHKDTVQAISIGSSHSEAIDFDVMGLSGQTLARAGADLFEVERYIASIEDQLPNLQTMFIALPYYAFSRDNATLDNMKILRVELYMMLPIWKPVNGDADNLILGKLHGVSQLMSVARPDHWHNVFYTEKQFSDLFHYPAAADTHGTEAPCQSLSIAELESHARDIAGRNISSSQEMAGKHPDLPHDAFIALAETIERLQEKGIDVILYTPPYYVAYNKHFTDGGSTLVAQMHQALAKLQTQYQVAYYDFSQDPALVFQPELFFNSDHLNICGQKVFSERLLQAMANGHNASNGN